MNETCVIGYETWVEIYDNQPSPLNIYRPYTASKCEKKN